MKASTSPRIPTTRERADEVWTETLPRLIQLIPIAIGHVKLPARVELRLPKGGSELRRQSVIERLIDEAKSRLDELLERIRRAYEKKVQKGEVWSGSEAGFLSALTWTKAQAFVRPFADRAVRLAYGATDRDFVDSLDGEWRSPEQVAHCHRLWLRYRQVLDGLPPAKRELLEASFAENYEDLAARWGRKVRTLHVYANRLREEIKKQVMADQYQAPKPREERARDDAPKSRRRRAAQAPIDIPCEIWYTDEQ